MSALLIFLTAGAGWIVGALYGGWLAKQRGRGADNATEQPTVFSMIGSVNGSILACVFGWVPVVFWCILGGIFFSGPRDFLRAAGDGAIRVDFRGSRAGRLFALLSVLVLLLFIAVFIRIAADTWASDHFGITAIPTDSESTAMISALLIVLAALTHDVTGRLGVPVIHAVGGAGICSALVILLGLRVGIAMPRIPWVIFLCLSLTVTSLLPARIFQMYDRLSGLWFRAVIWLALVGILITGLTGTMGFAIPAFAGREGSGGAIFPTLFVTVACGFSDPVFMISSGRARLNEQKQAEERMERQIGRTGYGFYSSALAASAPGILALLAVGAVFGQYTDALATDNPLTPHAAFAAGIASLFSPAGATACQVIRALLSSGFSVWTLVSLGKVTRCGRALLFDLLVGDGAPAPQNGSGWRKMATYPWSETLILMALGGIMSVVSLRQLWELFGAANQLLAALFLSTLSAWLKDAGKKSRIILFPAAFLFVTAISYLALDIVRLSGVIVSGGAQWNDCIQLSFVVLTAIVAFVLTVELNRSLFSR